MKTLSYLLIFLLLLFALSCKRAVSATNDKITIETPAQILQSDHSFFQYLAHNLYSLTRKYKTFNAAGDKISKLEFLHQLTTGKYLFLQTSTDSTKLSFKLYPLNANMQVKYGQIISAYLLNMYADYQWVGQKFPAFDFVDIEGKHYNSDNTKGKIVVLKYWFVGCQACQEEMPELNKMVAAYKNHNDMVFISIAPDNASRLKAFFSTHPFDYIKVPDQGYFINKVLKLNEAPTHFVINKQGIIVNVVDNPQELEYSLKEDI
jgi:peroxiredoxin